jgi:type IV secretion system protein VirB3
MDNYAAPIHGSVNRPNLFLNGDRELVMFTALMAVALIFAAQQWGAAVFGVLLWLTSLYLLRLMAKSDPQMRQVYMRHRKYKAYYPPHSTPFKSLVAQ